LARAQTNKSRRSGEERRDFGALNECANLGKTHPLLPNFPDLESFLISGLFWNGNERGCGARACADDRADRARREADS